MFGRRFKIGSPPRDAQGYKRASAMLAFPRGRDSRPSSGSHDAAVLGELGVDGETIARLLARDAQNAAAVHAMLEARAAAEAASTDD